MKFLNLFLCVLMLVFAGVQLNDPDGPIWMLIYLIPAVWAAIAAFRGSWLSIKLVRALLFLCIVCAIAATLYFWPKTAGWWKTEVWWEVETAREGMGMMIVSIVLFVAWITSKLNTFTRPSRNRQPSDTTYDTNEGS